MKRDSGITLIELVVAMALFFLVAVMSLQALNGVLRAQGRIVSVSDNTGQLSLALTLLRSDLSNMVPIVFYTPAGLPESALRVSAPGPEIAFSAGGQPSLADPDGNGFNRVVWRLDTARARLTRQIWPALDPGSESQLSPPMEMLTGVTSLGLRRYYDGVGWQDWTEQPADSILPDLPLAVEVTLGTTGFGTITMIEAFR